MHPRRGNTSCSRHWRLLCLSSFKTQVFLWCWQVGRRHYLDLSWRGGAQRPVLSFILGTDSLLLLPAHSWRKKKVECRKLRSALRCPSLEGRLIARVSLISTTASFQTYWEEFAAEAGFISRETCAFAPAEARRLELNLSTASSH